MIIDNIKSSESIHKRDKYYIIDIVDFTFCVIYLTDIVDFTFIMNKTSLIT